MPSGLDALDAGIAIHLPVEAVDPGHAELPGERQVKAIRKRQRALVTPESQGISQSFWMIGSHSREGQDFEKRIRNNSIWDVVPRSEDMDAFGHDGAAYVSNFRTGAEPAQQGGRTRSEIMIGLTEMIDEDVCVNECHELRARSISSISDITSSAIDCAAISRI